MSHKRYRVARTLWAGLFPFYLMEKLGKLPPEIEIVDVDEYDETLEMLATGALDANFNSLADTLLLVGRGTKLKLIMPSDLSVGVDGFLSGPDCQGILDLAGKRIGISLLTYPHILLLQILKKYGLSEKEVELVPVRGEQVIEAILAGKIDVGHTWGIHLQEGMQRGLKVIFTSSEYPGLLVDSLVVREEVLAESRGVWKSFAMALDGTIEWWKQNPAQGNIALAAQTGLSPALIQDMLVGVSFFTHETAGALFDKNESLPPNLFAGGGLFNRFFLEKGVLRQAVDLDSILQPL